MALEMYDFALADYYSALEIDITSSEAYYRRGLLYTKIDRLENAIKDFKRAINYNPDNDDAMIELAYAKMDLGQKDAMKYINKAIKINPCSTNYTYRVLARQKIAQRKFYMEKLTSSDSTQYIDEIEEVYSEKQAKDDIKDLNKAISLDPEESLNYRFRGSRYYYLGENEKAVEDYNKLIELEPDDTYYNLRARAEYRAGLYEEAIYDCNIDINLDNSETIQNSMFIKAVSKYCLGRYEDAIEDLDEIFSIEVHPDCYYFRGLANFELKNYFDAYGDFTKALELSPDIESHYDQQIPLIMKIFLRKKKNNDQPLGLSKIK